MRLILTHQVSLVRTVGLYYSLQFLSLADATVITFLGPLATGLLGYLVLGEKFTAREAIGGVVSLSGVVLIARPAFLFGRKAADADLDTPMGSDTLTSSNTTSSLIVRGLAAMMNASIEPPALASTALNYAAVTSPDFETEGVTERQRLLAVGLALLGVCGGAGAYITIRAIGRRASATHSVAYFSLYSTIVSGILMVATGTKFVLPKSPKWCALLVCVGVFGLAAQVRFHYCADLISPTNLLDSPLRFCWHWDSSARKPVGPSRRLISRSCLPPCINLYFCIFPSFHSAPWV